ncbi:MAG: hypothetical protein AAF840_04545, partial [Bacteroidota bacterium]
PITYDITKDHLFNIGIEQGIEEGAHQRTLAFVERMLKFDVDAETIAQYTGLTTEEVEKIVLTIKQEE